MWSGLCKDGHQLGAPTTGLGGGLALPATRNSATAEATRAPSRWSSVASRPHQARTIDVLIDRAPLSTHDRLDHCESDCELDATVYSIGSIAVG